MDKTTAVWRLMLHDLLDRGAAASPTSAGGAWKGAHTKELMAYRTAVPMAAPIVMAPSRKLGMRFLAAECAWIAGGDDRVETISPYSRVIAKFSDDGVRFAGAYGPRFVEQLAWVVGKLAEDPASRQAVIEIWRPSPRSSRDVPCTLSWQYLIRDGKLNCVASMRSSDAWTGIVYDWATFSTCAAVVAIELRDMVTFRLGLGSLILTAGSQHLYLEDEKAAAGVLEDPTPFPEYAPLDLDEFDSSAELVAHLWALARGTRTDKLWMRELF